MIVDVLSTSIMVTGLVLVMMLLVESLNVLSRGAFRRQIHTRGGRLPGVLIGSVPGCFGGFINVTLYVHGAISLGALAGSMIAASGDEAFVMLALFPRRALLLFALLIGYGLVVAWVVDRLWGSHSFPGASCASGLTVHDDEQKEFRLLRPWSHEWSWSLHRALLLGAVLAFALAIAAGWVASDEPAWLRAIIFGLTVALAWLVLAAPEHFVREHLLRHVAREHAPRVFLWTAGALLVTEWIGAGWPGMEVWIQQHQAIALLTAALVGLIPESGPHLVFATLYASGVLPFSVLVASSVVQDGHGMLPLLAESRTEFLRVKAINLVAGLVLGFALMLFGL